MLRPLFNTVVRLWLVGSLVAYFVFDVSASDVMLATAAAALVGALGVVAALLTITPPRASGRLYDAAEVAGAKAMLFDGDNTLLVPLAPPARLPSGQALDLDRLSNIDAALALVPSDLLPAARRVLAQPGYGTALARILNFMGSHPNTPAATVPGGHRGATLLEHSFNVWRTIRQEVASFEYRGMTDASGNIYYTLIDQNLSAYRFEADDPLVALAAVAHDVGKILCYQPGKNGRWVEVLDEHDTQGARLLRALRLHECMPRDECERLTVCVGHYHKLGSIPQSKWIDDRARALVTLLYQADVKTGKLEGQGAYDAYIKNVVKQVDHVEQSIDDLEQQLQHDALLADAPQPEPEPAAPLAVAQAAPQDAPQSPAPPTSSADSARANMAAAQHEMRIGRIMSAAAQLEQALRQAGATGAGLHQLIGSLPKPLSAGAQRRARLLAAVRNKVAHGERIPDDNDVVAVEKCARDVLDALAEKPARYEGKTALDHLNDDEVIQLAAKALNINYTSINTRQSFAYKFGSWLYLYEQQFAVKVWESLSREERESYCLHEAHFWVQTPGKHNEFTRRFMRAAANKGALRQEWGGQYWGDMSAYFWVMPKRKSDNVDPAAQEAARSKHVIIVRAALFGANIFDLDNAHLEPTIQGAVYKPLSDPTTVTMVAQKQAQWKDPPSKQERTASKMEQKLHKQIEQGNIVRAPFEPSLITQIKSDDAAQAFCRHEKYGNIFRCDVVLKYFDAPTMPHEIIEVDGVQYFAFVKGGKTNKKPAAQQAS